LRIDDVRYGGDDTRAIRRRGPALGRHRRDDRRRGRATRGCRSSFFLTGRLPGRAVQPARRRRESATTAIELSAIASAAAIGGAGPGDCRGNATTLQPIAPAMFRPYSSGLSGDPNGLGKAGMRRH
jgi:hypothetical protein